MTFDLAVKKHIEGLEQRKNVALYTKEQLRHNYDDIYLGSEDNRQIRAYISELRKEGIIYVSVGKRAYKRIENCSQEEIDAFVSKQMSSMATQYFNTLRPLMEYIKNTNEGLQYQMSLFDELFKEEI